MKKFDFISGLFLFFLSIGICLGSLQMEVGKFNAPGSGFFPLITGGVLMLFSLVIIIRSRKQSEFSVKFWLPGANKRAIITAFIIILIYILLLERLGFLVTTIFFFILVSRFVSGHSWKTVLVFSFIASVSTYLVFKFILQAPLPQGIFEGVF